MASVVETYRLTRKTPDLFWNTWVARPVAAVVVRALEPTRVTPNQVTLSAAVLGLLSAALVATLPGTLGLVAAVVVLELAYVLDCADGMLARLRGTASAAGHLLDFLMDEIKALAILAAASVRLWREHGDERFLLVGLAGLVAVASGVALTTFVRRPEIAGGEGAGPERPRAGPVALVERAAKLVVHYPSYILLVAFTGRLELYLYPYVAVSALHALATFARVAVRFGRA